MRERREASSGRQNGLEMPCIPAPISGGSGGSNRVCIPAIWEPANMSRTRTRTILLLPVWAYTTRPVTSKGSADIYLMGYAPCCRPPAGSWETGWSVSKIEVLSRPNVLICVVLFLHLIQWWWTEISQCTHHLLWKQNHGVQWLGAHEWALALKPHHSNSNMNIYICLYIYI